MLQQHPSMDGREQNKAPLKEEIDALRVTLSREERLLQVISSEIETVTLEHAKASHALSLAQAALDAAVLVYRTSETMLSGLKAQHAQLSENVHDKRAALHPIRRVPEELWKDIFTIWVDEEEKERVSKLDTHVQADLSIPASLVAASVSSFWRKTALSTPSLWRFITIPNQPLSEIKAHIHEWAKRSAPRIVSLILWNVGRESWSKDPALPTSLDGLRYALSSLKDRIGRIEVHFQRSTPAPAVQIFSAVMSEPRHKLSNLSEIWLEYTSIIPESLSAHSSLIPDRTFQLHRLKNLHTLTLRNLFWNTPSGLKSLRVLKIESIFMETDVNSFRHLLANSKELEEVEFLTLASTAHPIIPPGGIVDYPRLKKLSVCPRWLATVHEDLSQVLTLPALRTLRLIACQVAPFSSREADAVSRFIADVAPTVEELYFNLRGELFHTQILNTRAAITRLELVNTEVPIEIIERLTNPISEGNSASMGGASLGSPTSTISMGSNASRRWVLPHLEEIRFEDCDLPPEIERALAQLVEVRAEVTPYLRGNANAKLGRVSVRRNSMTAWQYPVVWT